VVALASPVMVAVVALDTPSGNTVQVPEGLVRYSTA
jgi:hypothetical protein